MSSVSLPVDDRTFRPKPHSRLRWTFWVVSGIVAIVLFFAVMVPTMCGSREGANRIKSSSNLRQLGLAIALYAQSHSGRMPENWAELARASDVTADIFISPSSNDDRLKDSNVSKWTSALDDPSKNNCSYRYTAGGLASDQATDESTVIAFEPTDHNSGDGIHILFGSGSVIWVPVAKDGQSKRSYQKLLADDASHVRPLRWTS